MALANRLRDSVTIQRATEGARNDYGIPTQTFATLATVDGWLQPQSRRLRDEASSGGAVAEGAICFMLPTDVTEADRLVVDGETYDIDSVINAAGKDHHLEVLCHRAEVV